MKPREQGDWGERMAAAWLLEQGYGVYIPFGHSPDVDLVADIDGRLVRVQVKSCRRRSNNRWRVQLCTHGGNRSWNGTVKLMDASAATTYLWPSRTVAVGLSRVALGGGTAINLGGPKYAMYEVQPGPPMPVPTLESSASKLA